MPIHTATEWSHEELHALIDLVTAKNGKLEFAGFTESEYPLPLFAHTELNLNFIYIPSGSFDFGLTDDDVASIEQIDECPPLSYEELQPASTVLVPHFLITEKPILNSEFAPSIVSFEVAEDFAKRNHCKLPSERQWEYSCRARKKELFPFGNAIPDDYMLGKWFSWDCKASEWCNAFGLKNIFFGEFCEDEYYASHYRTGSPEGHVVKGGAAFFWPWQDKEWIWCLTAMRCSSTEMSEEMAAFRLVVEL